MNKKGGEPQLGRWAYCKNCYKCVKPEHDYDIVYCSECRFGLAPYHEVCRFGSLAAWQDNLLKWFLDTYYPDRN